MTRIMYDSTTPWDIPRDAEMVAYYVDGRYAWPQAWLDLFPRAVKVSISAIGARVAQVGDVEVGCIWPPANAVPWVRRARAAGIDPTIYCNELNDWPPVRRAFWAAGEPEPHYWVARYNGVAQIPAGAVARQYAHPHDGDGVADRPWETGFHYDKSVVADFWPGVDSIEEEKVTEDEANMIADRVYAKIMDTRIDRSSTEGDPPQSGNFPLRWLFAALDGHITGIKTRIADLKDRLAALDAKVDQISTGGVSEERIGEIAVEAVRTEMTD